MAFAPPSATSAAYQAKNLQDMPQPGGCENSKFVEARREGTPPPVIHKSCEHHWRPGP
jgi:hypothetical protein